MVLRITGWPRRTIHERGDGHEEVPAEAPEAVDSASGIQGKTASRAGHTRESGGIVNIDPLARRCVIRVHKPSAPSSGTAAFALILPPATADSQATTLAPLAFKPSGL